MTYKTTMKRKVGTAVHVGRSGQATVALFALLLSVCASAAPLRYLALGDSFTAGTGSSPEHSFPSRLIARWKSFGREVDLRNVAVNGYRTDDVIAKELPELESLHPDVVSLAIGANDIVAGTSLDGYRAKVKQILRAILDAGVKPQALFVIPQPDWTQSPIARQFGEPAKLHEQIERFNAALSDETRAVGAKFINLWPMMVLQMADGLVASDGLHPNAEAYDAWSAEIAKSFSLPPPARGKKR